MIAKSAIEARPSGSEVVKYYFLIVGLWSGAERKMVEFRFTRRDGFTAAGAREINQLIVDELGGTLGMTVPDLQWGSDRTLRYSASSGHDFHDVAERLRHFVKEHGHTQLI